VQLSFVFKHALLQTACHADVEGQASAGYDVGEIELLVHCRTLRAASGNNKLGALKANAGPSAHHPQAEKRLGSRSLRMTAVVGWDRSG